MEEVRNQQEEYVLPAKRKPDPELVVEGQDDESSKKAKLENSVDGAEDKKIGKGSQNDDVCSVKYEDEQDEDDEEDYKAGEEEEDENDERSNGEAEIDRKGKAIITSDDKGKGKLVDGSDSDSDSDSSEFGSDSDTDGESDLSDDPLAEVDLDNILPSRTRRRPVHSGLVISNSNAAGNPKHDGDSDPSDA